MPTKTRFIYLLRVAPEVCYQRMCERNRGEEGGVTLDYLQDLHYYHNQIFIHNQHLLPAPVEVIYCVEDFFNTLGIKCKKCGKCGIIKRADCYHRCGKDGLQGYCKDCRREYQRSYMNKRYKDPDFYEKQLYCNSLNRIKSKPACHSNELLGCQDRFYLEWLDFQRREHEIVTGF